MGVSMEIVDYKVQLKAFYRPMANQVDLLDVPVMSFLMIDGQGDPKTSKVYSEAVEALFSVSTVLKSIIKKTQGIDYGVMPLEARWWKEGDLRFSESCKETWNWTLMIYQPSPVTRKLSEKAIAEIKLKQDSASLTKLRLESFLEGRVAQKLHTGPFDQVGPVIQALHERIHTIGAKPVGKHHEIYLSDLRKAVPEKWRTIVRQPYI
jgi:hypothetical protein